MSLKSKVAAVLLAGCYIASLSYNSAIAGSSSESDSTGNVISANTTAIFEDSSDAVLGNPNGSQQIAVFVDPYCSHCRNYQLVLNTAVKAMPNLRIVFKDFPIFGDRSRYAITIMKAAKIQNKYFDMQKLIHEQEEQLSMSQLLELAQQIPGIDMSRLEKDVELSSITTMIDNTLALAKKLNIDGTPTVIVGKQKKAGEISLSDLADALNSQD